MIERDETKAGFTKHMVRLRHDGTRDNVNAVGDVFPEVVLINSHDGSSSYHLNAGLLRVVCLNGLVACGEQYAAVRISHSGKIVEKVIEGSYEVLEESIKALTASTEWRGIALNRDEQMILAEGAHTLRFADADGHVSTPILPEQMLRVRRSEDRDDSLWTTFNRVQENVIRGGLHGVARTDDGRRRKVSTREIKGIDQNLKLNQALWQLTERMAALKAAA